MSISSEFKGNRGCFQERERERDEREAEQREADEAQSSLAGPEDDDELPEDEDDTEGLKGDGAGFKEPADAAPAAAKDVLVGMPTPESPERAATPAVAADPQAAAAAAAAAYKQKSPERPDKPAKKDAGRPQRRDNRKDNGSSKPRVATAPKPTSTQPRPAADTGPTQVERRSFH